MNIRQQYELFEDQFLSPYATRSRKTRGRVHPFPPCEVRTEFQRDRDRLIHSKAFRRLKYKTQVFIAPEGDHYRTRLTHTLEVAQIARTIARALRLNEDLAEAIALGHDLGHTPFGHAGEEALNELLSGGFRHYEQSLRVVDVLEGNQGLNLTYEVRDGILKHSGEAEPETLEGMVVKISDRIAYINHDIDDAIRAGIISFDELPHDCVEVLGREHNRRIDTMVKDTIRNSMGQSQISMSNDVGEATQKLRDFLFSMVYLSLQAQREENKARFIVKKIFRLVLNNPGLLGFDQNQKPSLDLERATADFIAGMTDRYAIRFFNHNFMPLPLANLG